MIELHPLTVPTTCAELIEQLRIGAMRDYPEGSTFRIREIAGRRYWYVQAPTTVLGRPPERYVGLDTPALAASITAARAARADADRRRIMVRSLLAAGLPRPDAWVGDVLSALADAGVFRLRGVVVGTIAYQAYGALLGVRMKAETLRTGDVDLAQDFGVSVAIDDALELDMLSLLRTVSPGFQPITDAFNPRHATAYADGTGRRVDVLTTARGGAPRKPSALPSLRTHATPLRFLDYLLRDPVEAALLHRRGVLLRVPAPARFAIHKLIIGAERATSDAPKSAKDLAQASALIAAHVALRRDDDIAEAWEEAISRGGGWRQRLLRARRRLAPDIAAQLPA